MIRHTKHYFRAGFLVFVGLLLFLLVRGLLIPSSFNKYGFYRADNVKEQMAKSVHYGSPDICADCHSDVWQQKQKGPHKPVPCQDCHAPLSEHVDLEKGELVGPMPIQRTVKLCLRCHLKLPSRPSTFPQIDLEDHLAKVPDAHKPEVCLSCHSPHDPLGKKN